MTDKITPNILKSAIRILDGRINFFSSYLKVAKRNHNLKMVSLIKKQIQKNQAMKLDYEYRLNEMEGV